MKSLSEEKVKEALGINSFREISKNKIIEFVSLIPNMDKEVAIAIINQFPTYSDSAKSIITQLSTRCDNIIKDNNSSQKETVEAYKTILNALSEMLEKDNITKEERDEITDKMIMIADKIAAKDSENKAFLMEVLKNVSQVGLVVVLLGVSVLGVNVKEIKLPRIKRN